MSDAPVNFWWTEREAPLERCPSPRCRRSGLCDRAGSHKPCRRTHCSQPELYEGITVKLLRFKRDMERRRQPGDPPPLQEGSPEFEERFAELYYRLREGVEADMAEEMRERAQAKPAAKRKKPARGLASKR